MKDFYHSQQSVIGLSPAKFKVLLLILLAVAMLLLTWFNGIARALNDSMVDFNTLYAGTRLFMQGATPYYAAPLHEVLGPIVPNQMSVQITLPGVFGLMSPIALLDHATASMLWLIASVLSIAGSIALALRLADLRWNSYYGLMLITACLMLGPFRMGLRQGQVDNIVLLLVLLAICLIWETRMRIASAILLGLGIALKPTSAGLFSIYFLLRGRIPVALASLLFSGGVVVICALILTITVPQWWNGLAEVVASDENNFNKVNALNGRLDQLTHLAAGFFAMFKSTYWAGMAGYLICLPILFRTLFSAKRDAGTEDRRETFLRELSIVAMIGMLVVYHRFYSAVFLVLPFIWAVYQISRNKANAGTWIILAMTLFVVVNGQALVYAIFERHLISFLDGSSWVEEVILQFYFIWLQLLVLMILFYDQIRKTRLSFTPGNSS